MKIKYKYSIKSELEIIERAIKNNDFYIKNSYAVSMPRGYSLESSNLSGIEEQVKKEFDRKKFSNIERVISENIDRNKSEIDAFLRKIPYTKPKKINTTLTQYGVGGSYYPPNTMTININYDSDYFRTFIHEFIHCIIEEPVIKRFNISHWDKESLVDYLIINNFREIFPNYKYQKKKPSKGLLDNILINK